MGQNTPHYKTDHPAGGLNKLPPLREKVETIEIRCGTESSISIFKRT